MRQLRRTTMIRSSMPSKRVQSVAWHEERLANVRQTLEREKEGLARLQSRIEQIEADVLLLNAQIAEAKRRGIAGFDADRFLKKRSAK